MQGLDVGHSARNAVALALICVTGCLAGLLLAGCGSARLTSVAVVRSASGTPVPTFRSASGTPVPASAISRLRAVADRLVRGDSQTVPRWVSVVATSRKKALTAAEPFESYVVGPKNVPVYLMTMKGRFWPTPVPTPVLPGKRPPTGRYLSVLVDAKTFHVLYMGLGSQPPPIPPASLGPLTYLTHLARPQPAPSPSPAVLPTAPCVTARLKITLTRTAGAVLGNEGGYLRFANEGPGPCELHGWPTVVAVTATGKTVKVLRAVHGTMLGAWQYVPPLPILRLRPRAAAYAVVDAGDVSSNPRVTRCPGFRWLRVTPPGGSGYVTLSAHLFERVYLPDCGSPAVTAMVPLHDLAH